MKKYIPAILIWLNVVFLLVNIAAYHNNQKTLNYINESQQEVINVQGNLRFKFNGELPFSLGLHTDGRLEIEGDTIQAIKYLMEELHKSWQQNQEPIETISL